MKKSPRCAGGGCRVPVYRTGTLMVISGNKPAGPLLISGHTRKGRPYIL
nr:MAG TPA: hypothetical protein [Caudoviricetes sp.]